MPAPLTGIFCPNLVPLTTSGDINEPELRRYVDWLIAHGVHGLYPNGSTSEFTRYTPEERRRIVKIVCDQAAGRALVLAGAAEANVRETLSACEAYLACGARAVAIVSPFYYRLSPDSVFAYFREIAKNSPIDVTLYNIPMFASPIDVPTIQRLAELPRIIGIKDSSGDISFMLRLIAAVRPVRPDFAFLTGWEAALVPMLLLGCQGATNATSNVAPELLRKIFDLVQSQKIDQANAIQPHLTALFDALMSAADFPLAFRAATELRGVKMGPSRQPQTESQSINLKNLETTLRSALSAVGAQL